MSTRARMERNTKPVGRPGAFTLIELITVIAVMAVLIAIGVPAFRAALASSDKSLAENQFRLGLESARQLAIQNSSRDAAAVFFYEPGGRLTIVPCIFAGTLVDRVAGDQNQTANPRLGTRDVFVPAPEVAPAQLPRGWMVRGFAPAGSLSTTALPTGWYETIDGEREFQADANGEPRSNWVFPETGFYATRRSTDNAQGADLASDGADRQSFLVRFRAGTGHVDPSESRLCLVVSPAPSETTNDATGELDNWRLDVPIMAANRIDTAPDLQRYVSRILTAREIDGSAGVDEDDDEARRDLLGDVSSDTVLCRPLTELALYKEQSLASALGARGLNAATGSIYGNERDGPGGDPDFPDAPRIDLSLFPGSAQPGDIARDTNLWMTGLLRTPDNDAYIESDAKLFAIDRYLGQGRKLGDDREATP